MARADTLKEYLKNQTVAEEDQDFEDKAMEFGGKVIREAEPILRTLDYPAGLVRGAIAGGLEAATGRDDLVDIKDVIKGKAPSSGEILEKLGVPEGGSLSDVLPGMYSKTGKGLALEKGGLFDPTARGVAGAAIDVALDPLALLAGKGAKAVAKEAYKDPAAFKKQLLEDLKDQRGELDLSTKRRLEGLKEYTPKSLSDALELKTDPSTLSYVHNRDILQDALKFAAQRRLGVSESMPEEQVLELAAKILHPEVIKQRLAVQINPELAKSLRVKGGLSMPSIALKPGAIRPRDATMLLESPNLSTFLHEAQHFKDYGLNPYIGKGVEEFIPYIDFDTYGRSLGMQDPKFLASKLAEYQEIPLAQAERIIESKVLNAAQEAYEWAEKTTGKPVNTNNKETMSLMAEYASRKLGQDIEKLVGGTPWQMQQFGSAGHFYEYPKHYELQRSAELLNPDKPIITPDLSSNYGIINEISDIAAHLTPDEIKKMYIHKKFPNIKNILKGQ